MISVYFDVSSNLKLLLDEFKTYSSVLADF